MPQRPAARKIKKLGVPLQVFSETPWGTRITYKDASGKVVEVQNYEEAREYATQNGYLGIKINR